jgi:hypothetical protein
VPAKHRLQAAELADPDPVEYEPPPHERQFVHPDPVAYVPATHRLHAAELAEPDPVEYDPAVHRLQAAELIEPDPVEYDPATHRLQAAEIDEPEMWGKAESSKYLEPCSPVPGFIVYTLDSLRHP